MINFLVNVLSGMLFEVIYFTSFLIITKDLETKKFSLFLLIGLAYILCIMISRFKLLYYISFIILVYIILKLLYKDKTQIIDIFVFSLSTLYLTTISYICHLFLNGNIVNYYFIYVINRILLFLPFIFKNKFNNLYNKYRILWNRNTISNKPIKSITLRNVSLILLNLLIVFMNICALIKTGMM